jgi:hypothetical protein
MILWTDVIFFVNGSLRIGVIAITWLIYRLWIYLNFRDSLAESVIISSWTHYEDLNICFDWFSRSNCCFTFLDHYGRLFFCFIGSLLWCYFIINDSLAQHVLSHFWIINAGWYFHYVIHSLFLMFIVTDSLRFNGATLLWIIILKWFS